jgi:DNA-binding NtrC family response regulator
MAIAHAQRTESFQVEKPRSGQRVLIVDDEAAILFAYRKLIEREGFMIDICENIDEAIALIKSHHYYAVIADIRLAGTDNTEGLDLLRFVRKERPCIKVIIVTGFGTMESETAVLALGASYYFEKPVLPSKIIDVLNNLKPVANISLSENAELEAF